MKNNIHLFPTLLWFILFVVACSKSDSTPEAVTVTPVDDCSGTPGPLFTAVKTLVTQKCLGCHNASNKNGGRDFSSDCNIVSASTRIKTRAVDEGTMPPTGPLSQAEKNVINAWFNAGGLHSR